MSIDLAIERIGYFSSKIDEITQKVSVLEIDLLGTGEEDKAAKQDIKAQLARLNFQLGLCKEFIEFWKQVIQTTLNLIKSLQELAQGAR